MFNELREKLRQIASRLVTGPVGQFFRWWIDELEQVMPLAWREKLHMALRRVTLHQVNGTLRLGVDQNREVKNLGDFPASQDLSVQSQEIQDLLISNELTDAPRYLLLDQTGILYKQLKLPAATEPNLPQVLAFEMDRQTPFKVSDVYYDWKITDRAAEGGQLSIDLFVAPRNEVDTSIELLQKRNYLLAGVDVVNGARTLGLNLLPSAQRVRHANPRLKANLALAGLAVALLALVMSQSLLLREHQIEELETAIGEVQGEARQVMRIKEQITDASDAAGFLAKRRAEAPMAIEILSDLTRILPDDTYLDRLVIGRNNVQLQGKSQNAQRLIERVNESSLLQEAEFRGSTRLDARSGLEIFEVNAEVALVEAE